MTTQPAEKPQPLDAPQILENVAGILREREGNYDDPVDNFEAIGIVWTVFFANAGKLKDGEVIDALDVARAMVGMKMVRDSHKYKDDNWDDSVGYSACGRRIGSIYAARGITSFRGWIGKIGRAVFFNRARDAA